MRYVPPLPSLTSVRQHSYERGWLALESFIKFRDGRPAEPTLQTPELVVRHPAS